MSGCPPNNVNFVVVGGGGGGGEHHLHVPAAFATGLDICNCLDFFFIIICLQPEAKSCVETLKVFKTMLALRHTEQLLQEHQLDKPAYLDLPGARLIMQLYTDVPVTSAAGRGGWGT